MALPRLFVLAVLISLVGCGEDVTPQVSQLSVHVRAQTGAGPNDTILIEDGANPPLLVVAASMDSAVQFFELPSMTLKGSTFFRPNAEAISPNPWGLEASPDGGFVAVSLFDDHRVALIDVNSRKIVQTIGVPKAQHPTALKFVGGNLYVAFTNLQGFADYSGVPSAYGSGVLARFSINSGKLSYVDSVTLPCKNPSDITLDQTGKLAVSCAGSQFFDNNKILQLHDGAAVITIDTTHDLFIVKAVSLGHLSPSKIISSDDGFFLTSNLKRQVLFLPRDATTDATSVVIPLNDEAPDEIGYVSAMIKRSNDLALVADFRTDQIFALDLRTRTISPMVKLRDSDKPLINKGPLALTVSQTGELFVLMAMSAEIFSVTTEAL